MATTTRYATSLVDGSVAGSANALGAPDNTWTTDTGNTNWTARFQLGTPPTIWLTGTQTISVRVRTEASGGNDPSVDEISLYVAGTSVKSLHGSTTITSATGVDLVGTFDAAEVDDPNAIQIEIATSGGGGNPNLRRSVQMDAISWTVSYSETAPPTVFEVWNGSAWVASELKRWDGSVWVDAQAKRWNGTSWIDT